MDYLTFCKRIKAMCRKIKITASFANDEDTGRYIARLSDGTKIIGHASSQKVTVRWGSRGNHCSMALLPA